MQGWAGADHTTLLLNCYTKLKDVTKLDAFLRGSGATEGSSSLPFDVETAVKVIFCLVLRRILFSGGCCLPPLEGLWHNRKRLSHVPREEESDLLRAAIQ